MHFEITERDHDGKPTSVFTDDGFVQTGRKFDPDQDGWMEGQLDPRDFLAVKIGRQTEALIHEVNALRRENFYLKQSEKRWMSACGFGPNSVHNQTHNPT